MKAGETTLAVLIDYSKAFNTISHEGLAHKLCNLGCSTDYIE